MNSRFASRSSSCACVLSSASSFATSTAGSFDSWMMAGRSEVGAAYDSPRRAPAAAPRSARQQREAFQRSVLRSRRSSEWAPMGGAGEYARRCVDAKRSRGARRGGRRKRRIMARRYHHQRQPGVGKASPPPRQSPASRLLRLARQEPRSAIGEARLSPAATSSAVASSSSVQPSRSRAGPRSPRRSPRRPRSVRMTYGCTGRALRFASSSMCERPSPRPLVRPSNASKTLQRLFVGRSARPVVGNGLSHSLGEARAARAGKEPDACRPVASCCAAGHGVLAGDPRSYNNSYQGDDENCEIKTKKLCRGGGHG